MKFLIRKSVYNEVIKSYIARWGYPGHYRYKYYEPDKGYRSSSKTEYKDFSSSLDDFVKNGMKGDKPFNVMENTPEILKQYGFSDNPITIDPTKVRKILSDDKNVARNAHNLPIKILKDLPNQLRNPLAIMKGKDNKKIILTEHIINNNPVIAIIELDKISGGNQKVNSVRSLYDKEKTKIAEWLNDNSITVYKDKKRYEQLASRGLQLPKGDNPAVHSI